jgi:hypothetical protein
MNQSEKRGLAGANLESRKCPKLARRVGRLWVGGTARGVGYAKPSPVCSRMLIAPIISRGPKPWKALSPFNLMAGALDDCALFPSLVSPYVRESIADIQWRRENVPPPGALIENVWQFAKAHEYVARQRQTKGAVKRGTQSILWMHDAEKHALPHGAYDAADPLSFDGVVILPKFLVWRSKGWHHDKPVRRPNGTVKKGGVPLFSKWGEMRLDYVGARKAIYIPIYQQAARRTAEYKRLLRSLQDGQDVLLIDVDGPCVRTYPHGVESTQASLCTALHDTRRPFGHGYACAMALLEDLARI